MFCRTALSVALLALPAFAETPNLSSMPEGALGSAAQLVLAQRAYDLAMSEGEVLPLLAAIRLARGITLRPASGWERVTTGDAASDAPEGRAASPDPASDAVLEIARNLAGEDTDLQDLVYDLDAQIPRGRTETAVVVTGDLAPGQSDAWTLPLFGEVAAEIALVGDGDGPLVVTLRDESGATLCTQPASRHPMLCRLTPARNGFFTVTVQNAGGTVNSYRLIGN
jgi:hypothetical protein